MSSDPYVYPGTTVLKNIRGIRNQEILDCFEGDRVGQRSLVTAARDKDVRALRNETLCRCETDSAIASGDDCYLSFQLVHKVPPV
jgi:hypothetical protein